MTQSSDSWRRWRMSSLRPSCWTETSTRLEKSLGSNSSNSNSGIPNSPDAMSSSKILETLRGISEITGRVSLEVSSRDLGIEVLLWKVFPFFRYLVGTGLSTAIISSIFQKNFRIFSIRCSTTTKNQILTSKKSNSTTI